MSSVDTALQGALDFMVYVAPFVLLTFGTLGCLGNFLIFTSKRLRKNSCAHYFLCAAVFELLTLCFGLISRIADQYGSLLQRQNRMYCKFRSYLTFVFPTTVTFLLLMATFDRCMSTSTSTRLRRWSQLKVARIVTVVVFLMSMIACSHIFVFVDHYPACSAQPGLYALFYIIFLIVYGGLGPDSLILLFGLWTMRNVAQSRARVAQVSGVTQQQQQQTARKTNSQFVVMVLSQVIISIVIDVLRLSTYAYYILTANRTKTSRQQTVDVLILQISLFLSYLNYSKSFYTNTLSSSLFRSIFVEACRSHYRRLTGKTVINERSA